MPNGRHAAPKSFYTVIMRTTNCHLPWFCRKENQASAFYCRSLLLNNFLSFNRKINKRSMDKLGSEIGHKMRVSLTNINFIFISIFVLSSWLMHIHLPLSMRMLCISGLIHLSILHIRFVECCESKTRRTWIWYIFWLH